MPMTYKKFENESNILLAYGLFVAGCLLLVIVLIAVAMGLSMQALYPNYQPLFEAKVWLIVGTVIAGGIAVSCLRVSYKTIVLYDGEDGFSKEEAHSFLCHRKAWFVGPMDWWYERCVDWHMLN